MKIYIYDHDGEVKPSVAFYQKNPDDDEDFELWVATIEQGGGKIDMTFRSYEALHNFATRLMTEVASARP